MLVLAVVIPFTLTWFFGFKARKAQNAGRLEEALANTALVAAFHFISGIGVLLFNEQLVQSILGLLSDVKVGHDDRESLAYMLWAPKILGFLYLAMGILTTLGAVFLARGQRP